MKDLELEYDGFMLMETERHKMAMTLLEEKGNKIKKRRQVLEKIRHWLTAELERVKKSQDEVKKRAVTI